MLTEIMATAMCVLIIAAAEEHRKRGLAAFSERDFEQAIEEYRAEVAAEPGSAAARRRLALALSEAGVMRPSSSMSRPSASPPPLPTTTTGSVSPISTVRALPRRAPRTGRRWTSSPA